MRDVDSGSAGVYIVGAYHGSDAGFCISRAECWHTFPLDAPVRGCAEPLCRSVNVCVAVVGGAGNGLDTGVSAMPEENDRPYLAAACFLRCLRLCSWLGDQYGPQGAARLDLKEAVQAFRLHACAMVHDHPDAKPLWSAYAEAHVDEPDDERLDKDLPIWEERRRLFNNDRKTQRKILERDEYRCVRCGSARQPTVDHIVPLRKGGTNAETNLQTLCKRCNSRKGDRMGRAEMEHEGGLEPCRLVF